MFFISFLTKLIFFVEIFFCVEKFRLFGNFFEKVQLMFFLKILNWLLDGMVCIPIKFF